MGERFHAELDTPLGTVSFAIDARGRLVELRFGPSPATGDALDAAGRRVRDELAEYFARRRRAFGLPIAPTGTAFQRRVWRALMQVPYGQTASYADIARRIGRPGAARAVGQANGANPIPIVIPCHRVIAADGTIGGYSGGLDVKRRLLELEQIRLAA